jgi:putative PIN family toxin of toxin-antitoxin system
VADGSGPSGRILYEILNETGLITSVCSAEIYADWDNAAHRSSVQRYFNRRGVASAEYQAVLSDLMACSQVVQPTGEAPPCRDEKDRRYLHCAQFGQVDFIITSDADLLVLGVSGATRIVGPWEFAQIVLQDVREIG